MESGASLDTRAIITGNSNKVLSIFVSKVLGGSTEWKKVADKRAYGMIGAGKMWSEELYSSRHDGGPGGATTRAGGPTAGGAAAIRKVSAWQ